MEKKKALLSCDEAKQMDMVGYLSKLGHEPIKVTGADHWYRSPLRDEKSPSFKINRTRNRWFDFGSGQGGNLVDFGVQYFKCSVGEFLHRLEDTFPAIPQQDVRHAGKSAQQTIAVVAEHELNSPALIQYLTGRCIPAEIAKQYCREVRYKIAEKTFYGIGFKNNSGGYEIRNPFFKSASSPKDITTITNGGNSIAVFEGFFDFLSYLVISKDNKINKPDFLILNSLAFFEKAKPVMEQYDSAHLYLDNDAAGQNYSKRALSAGKPYVDESSLYTGCGDLNDYLCKSKSLQDKSNDLGQGLRR
ncbi:toprim domain-containing protein [Pedobacter sp. ISL-68]|uniref:toprim domain-containing protein n=1 Tax=unclassified Pedobacter TaxID=2628915 RepID=UPI001BE65FC6|nr:MULTISPECIES: toprim domain-containing protein [unclassified Pedobacter]MBT2561337.1 toprim domain-containing protein [Pedobacter sp. ISL-64]MBT2590726.1 toprim domain-containing protein [Pedobacter sp. ISL-68]